MTTPRPQYLTGRPDDRPAEIALAMIVDGVPRGSVVAYLHLETVLEAGVDPWDATVQPTTPTARGLDNRPPAR